MSIYKLISPLEIYLPRKTKDDKKYYLNINVYRNTHHQILNQAKVIYNEVMKEQISKLPVFEYLEEVDYIIYRKSVREFDTPNVGSIISKFFMDALVINNKIKDDNYKITPRHVIDFGGITDKDYCEIKLKGKTMNFSVEFTQEDITKALKTVYGKDVPDNCIDNLKFEVVNGAIKASTSLGSNSIGSTPSNSEPEDKPAITQRRRNKSLSEEFNEVTANTESEQPSGQVTESPSQESVEPESQSEEENKEVVNPDTEPANDTPPMESVEEVKTNTFGNRSMRRRIL